MDEQIKPVARFVSDLSCGGGGWCVGVMREANSTDEDPDEWYVKYADHQQSIDALRAEVDEQCRLHAIGMERELALIARAERAEAEAEALRALCRDMLPVFEAARPLVLNLERLRDAARKMAE